MKPEYGRALWSVVGPNPLEYPRPILKTVREEMDCGVVPGDKFAVAPDV
jgi:hypothetical protein